MLTPKPFRAFRAVCKNVLYNVKPILNFAIIIRPLARAVKTIRFVYILTLYSDLTLTYHMAWTERPGLPAFSLMAFISSSLGLTIGPFGSVDTRFSHCGFEGGAGGEGAFTGATGGRTGGGGGGGAPSSSSPGPEVRNFSLAAAS